MHYTGYSLHGKIELLNTESDNGRIGVIMLDTQFPRFRGDIGNPHTWPFDVKFNVVKGASALKVVTQTENQALQPFIDAALQLQSDGVSGITTSCGFLVLYQKQIAEQLSVPFMASSLMQVPWIQAALPTAKTVGILTISASALSSAHLECAGINHQTPIVGTENGSEFTRAVLGNKPAMDQSLCEKDNIEAAKHLLKQHPNVGAIVLECTNMAPYARAIQAATGLPVYSIYTLVRWFQAGLSPAAFK